MQSRHLGATSSTVHYVMAVPAALCCAACMSWPKRDEPAANHLIDSGVATPADTPQSKLHDRLREGCDPTAFPVSAQNARVEGAAPAEDETAWRAATSFEIELTHSSCYGSCPPYKLQLDQAGNVKIQTGDFAQRPGVYKLAIDPQQSRALFDRMIDDGFLQLRAQYEETSDGCASIHTDDFSSTFTLRAADHEKQVHMYWGCENSPANALLTELDQGIAEAGMIDMFIGTPAQQSDRLTFDFAESYVLYGADTSAVGLLYTTLGRCGASSTWSVHDCDGQQLAHGEVSGDTVAMLMSEDPFTWPGAGDERAVALLTPQVKQADAFVEPNLALNVRVLALGGDTTQTAVPGVMCEVTK